jgi:hypothetical protein
MSPSFTIAFAGDVSIDLGRSFYANADKFLALAAGATSLPTVSEGRSSVGGSEVSITAPYVAIGGFTNTSLSTFNPFAPVLALADATLHVNAGTIDLTGRTVLQNFGDATFSSTGDIRFYTPAQAQAGLSGALLTAGNLTFEAAQLYPTTASTFIVAAVGPTIDGERVDTTLTIRQNGSASAPLSVAGSLLLDATDIVQAGTIRAPDGSIVLGVSDTAAQAADFGNMPIVATRSVTLADGSLTSVSLDGRILPYGVTVDGLEWKYQVPGQPGVADLTAPPEKSIRLGGETLALDPGATVDLSGGGDLQASEWVAGTGGSRDLLMRTNPVFISGATPTNVPLYADGRNIYAVIPGF